MPLFLISEDHIQVSVFFHLSFKDKLCCWEWSLTYFHPHANNFSQKTDMTYLARIYFLFNVHQADKDKS